MPTAARVNSAVARGLEYAFKVAEGKIAACRWVKLACERQLKDIERWSGKDQPYYFDTAAAERVCDVIQHFPHIKGIWARDRKRIQLEPWQSFILSTVFGWKQTEAKTRRFRMAYIEVPRKNAKSTVTSALGNYLMACDEEEGAYVVSAANTRDQAKLVFSDAQLMARKEPGFLNKFGVDVRAHVIAQPGTASKFEALSAEHSNLDGLNIHAALIDELHAHPTRGLWDVLATATGSRTQPLIWAITTAGLERASVCYDQRMHVCDILQEFVSDETYFGVIYTRDDDDDPFDEATWIKANPNYGVSVFPESLRAAGKRAMVMPSERQAFYNKFLDIWTNAAISWLPPDAWDKCKDPSLDLEDFARQQCYIGLDLALRSDLAALVLAFPPRGLRDWWAVFGKYYLPEPTVNRSENTHYQGWEATGRLIATPGPVTDFDFILDTLADATARFEVLEIALDPADAGPLLAAIPKRGVRVPVEVRQSATNMSPGMVEMEGLVLSQRIRHDGDPVLAWMVSNVKAERYGDLIKPVKDSDEKKIDGVVALVMCLYRHMKREPTPDFSDGLMVF